MSRAYGPGSYDPNYERRGQDYPHSYVRWTENRNMDEFLRLVATDQVKVAPLITHEFPLERAPEAYSTILDPAANSLAVVLRYSAAPEAAGESFSPARKVRVREPASDPSDLRVALVGAGNLARWAHLPNLKKIPHATLYAVYSASGARGKSYARRFGAEYCCSDFNEILQDPAIDVMLILSRNQYHAPQAISALQAGKHVFLEKPMALTEAECREIYQAVNESRKQLTIGFNRRFAPFYVEQKRQLAKRSGPVVINCRVNSPGISGSYWMADPSIGGAILGEACHFLDLMYWLLDSEPVSVFAYSFPTDTAEPIGQNNIVASLRFADGSIGNLTYCTVGSKSSAGERVEVFAQGVGIETHDFKHLNIHTKIRRGRSSWWADKGYMEQLKGFLDGIREGNKPAVDVIDGARATVACLRILESASTSRPCQIDLTGALKTSEFTAENNP